MTTALISHNDGLNHITPDGHPERVGRLQSLLPALADLGLARLEAELATEEDLARCHPADYIGSIKSHVPKSGFHQIDGDTWMSPGSWNAALRAVGGAVQAVDMVMGGEVTNAFCATRPPGHHAETRTAMGFCLFGTVAIAAKHALDQHGLSRVAVVDFDVHHGNGTQDLLWSEARSLFVSSHQSPLWPGTGRVSEKGAYDNVMNVPLAPGTGGAEMRQVYTDLVFPRLRAFQPEMILISAGFDAHQDDPLAQLNWSTDDFRWITRELVGLARDLCGGRLVSTLEGGYDLSALASAGRAHVEELMEAGR